MKTLDEAWDWYQWTRRNLERMNRLARKHWLSLPWDGPLGNDDKFRQLEATDVMDEIEGSLRFIDDLAIVVLFSVVEQTVRTFVAHDARAEAVTLQHPALRTAARDAIEAIEEGSFFHVLDPYKPTAPELIEEVNQVRRYRNWVAHGRRGAQPPAVVPNVAYDRLTRFLDAVLPSA